MFGFFGRLFGRSRVTTPSDIAVTNLAGMSPRVIVISSETGLAPHIVEAILGSHPDIDLAANVHTFTGPGPFDQDMVFVTNDSPVRHASALPGHGPINDTPPSSDANRGIK